MELLSRMIPAGAVGQGAVMSGQQQRSGANVWFMSSLADFASILYQGSGVLNVSDAAQKKFGWLRHLQNPRLGFTSVLSADLSSTKGIGLWNAMDFCWAVISSLKDCFESGMLAQLIWERL